MLNTLKNNKSLTFYQYTTTNMPLQNNSSVMSGVSAVANSAIVQSTAGTTTAFNAQLNDFLNAFSAQREQIAQKIASGLSVDSNYQGARNDGVNLAWKYEKADIEMGGNGSADWNKSQQQEILERGKVRGAEGHHQKNVADHLNEQGNPDNIKFYKNKEEHLKEGHKGDFKNSTDGDMTDKDKMLKKTNSKRVFKNELIGLGSAVAIGLGVGFTIGFVVSLAQQGISPESLKSAALSGAKGGIESGLLSAVGYGIGRAVGDIGTKIATNFAESLSIATVQNVAKMINMGVIGTLTIAVFSVYQFAKLKYQGVDTRSAALQVGKQALFSLSLLAVSIAAQGIWGGPAGIIVSTSIGIILISYNATKIVHQRHISKNIREYTIEKIMPWYEKPIKAVL